MSLSVMYSYLRSCNTPSNGTPVSLTTSAKILQKKDTDTTGGEEQEGGGGRDLKGGNDNGKSPWIIIALINMSSSKGPPWV